MEGTLVPVTRLRRFTLHWLAILSLPVELTRSEGKYLLRHTHSKPPDSGPPLLCPKYKEKVLTLDNSYRI